ncbi:WD-40 repeat-containing protein, partial [Reticulomyxa filosa]
FVNIIIFEYKRIKELVQNKQKKIFKYIVILFLIDLEGKIHQRMDTLNNERQSSLQLALSEEEIQLIVHHWIRILKIRLGWIYDFNKYIFNYVMTLFIFILFINFQIFLQLCYDFIYFYLIYLFADNFFILDTFRLLSKLRKTFTGHTNYVYSIDFLTFDDNQFICSGSSDKTVRVWNVGTNRQIQSFNGHSNYVHSVKFSSYHYHNYHNYRQN